MFESIGDRILRLRNAKDMKQKELADKVGITEATLSRYENNLRSPKGDIAYKIADALDVTSDYLITGQNIFAGSGRYIDTNDKKTETIESLFERLREHIIEEFKENGQTPSDISISKRMLDLIEEYNKKEQ